MENTITRKRVLAVLFVLAAAFCLALYFSASAEAADAGDASAGLDGFMDDVKKASVAIANVMLYYARRIFWILAAIEVCWAGIGLATKGDLSFSSFASILVKEAMFIGFFYMLLNAPAYFSGKRIDEIIINGFRDVGAEAAGSPQPITPANVLSAGLRIAYDALGIAWKQGILKTIAMVLPCMVMIVIFAFSAMHVAVYIMEWYIAIPAGILLLGFGGSNWTKSYAEGYVRFLVSLAVKLLVLQVLLGIIMKILGEMTDTQPGGSGVGFLQWAFNLVALSVLTYLAVSKVPEMAGGMISGSASASGSMLTGAVAGAAGAVAGAAMMAAKGAMAYSDAKNASSSAGGSSSGGSSGRGGEMGSISSAASGNNSGSGGSPGAGGGMASYATQGENRAGGGAIGSALRGGGESGGMAPSSTSSPGAVAAAAGASSGGAGSSSGSKTASGASGRTAAGNGGLSGAGSSSSGGTLGSNPSGGDMAGASPGGESGGMAPSASSSSSGDSSGGDVASASSGGESGGMAPSASSSSSGDSSGGGASAQKQTLAEMGASMGLSKQEIRDVKDLNSGKYDGLTKASYRQNQAWAVKSAIRVMMGLGPTGSFTPGGGGAFRGQDLNYPPSKHSAYDNMNDMQKAMLAQIQAGNVQG